jgi:predicted GTPase
VFTARYGLGVPVGIIHKAQKTRYLRRILSQAVPDTKQPRCKNYRKRKLYFSLSFVGKIASFVLKVSKNKFVPVLNY